MDSKAHVNGGPDESFGAGGSSASREPNKNPRHTTTFADLRAKEAAEIKKRRQKAGLTPPGEVAKDAAGKDIEGDSAPPQDLVGLALSGGGIRAASVGLGALQALYKSGRFREIDYLSTVSGGGYIGGYLSSAAVASTRAEGAPATIAEALGVSAVDSASVATPRETDYGQPSLVQRFIFGGKYLLRPWEAANKYLIGLFSINLVFVSALVMFGALVALAWRVLDYDFVRDLLDLFGLDSSIVTALIPFDILFFFWAVAWLGSYVARRSDAPGKWAQRWLYFMAAALFIGITMLLVNPETKIGFLRAFTGDGKVGANETIMKWLLGGLAASLTPFLAPNVLLRMGQNPRNIWERVIFRVAMFALLVGVPLVVIGVLASPNLSDTARDPDDNLRAGDVFSWPTFLALMGPPQAPLNAADAAEFDQFKKQLSDGKLKPWLPQDHEALRTLRNLARRDLSFQVDDLEYSMARQNQLKEQLDADYPPRRRWTNLFRPGFWKDLAAYWSARGVVVDAQEKLCQDFSKYVLGSRSLPLAIEDGNLLAAEPRNLSFDRPTPPAANDNTPVNAFDRIHGTLVDRQKNEVKDPDGDGSDVGQDLADAKKSYPTWPPGVVKEFNLGLLRTMQPETFFTPGKAYRQLVIAGDQKLRLMIFLVSLVVFIIALDRVNLNATSLHRFYRNRLKHAYFIPNQDGKLDFDLSALNTTDAGAPYHLINATIDLTRPRFLDAVDAESSDRTADRRDVQTFIFSKHYCGSDATGWAETADYQHFRDDNISVADAIALSGSAIDPLRANSLGLTAAMSALNLTLGQWMPNPRFEKPILPPNSFALLKDCHRPVAESAYCYVSDGGFTDNLGIMSLIRRRCRLIVAVDASCDGDRAFIDLNWVIRMARIRFGVKILEPSDGKESERTLNTSCLDPNKRGNCERHYILAQIVYPEDEREHRPPSWLVYLKPSFTGDEGADLLKYRIEAPDFPNDDTANQFYEPARVEAYRQLGFHIADDFCGQLRSKEPKSAIAAVEALKESYVTARKQARDQKEQKRQLPGVAHVAAERVNTIVKVLQDQAANAARQNGNGQGADILQTKDTCPKGGAWMSAGECGHSVTVNMVKGEAMGECKACGAAPVKWIFAGHQ